MLTQDVMIASFKTISEVYICECASFRHMLIPAYEWVEQDEQNLAHAQYGLLQKGTFEKEYSQRELEFVKPFCAISYSIRYSRLRRQCGLQGRHTSNGLIMRLFRWPEKLVQESLTNMVQAMTNALSLPAPFVCTQIFCTNPLTSEHLISPQ